MIETRKPMDSTEPKRIEKKPQTHTDSLSSQSWRHHVASFLGGLSAFFSVPTLLWCLYWSFFALSLTPDDSEWGRFGSCGGAIALVWGGGIAVLVLALCLGVCASLFRTGSIGKVKLAALVTLGVVTATDIALWLAAYGGSGWWL